MQALCDDHREADKTESMANAIEQLRRAELAALKVQPADPVEAEESDQPRFADER